MRISSRASRPGCRPEAGSRPRPPRRLALAVLAVLGTAGAAQAQEGARAPLGASTDPRMVDQGSFDIRVGGRSSGTETFAIRRDGDGFTAVGRIVVEGASVGIQSLEVGLHTSAELSPERYEARTVERPVSRFLVSRTGNRLRLSTSTQRGERVTEFLARPYLMLLELGIAHQNWFLVRRLREIPSASAVQLEVLLPRTGVTAPVSLLRTDEDSVEVGDVPLEARRYDLRIGDVEQSVWADREGRILRAEIPARRWTALRQPDRQAPAPDEPQEAAPGAAEGGQTP